MKNLESKNNQWFLDGVKISGKQAREILKSRKASAVAKAAELRWSRMSVEEREFKERAVEEREKRDEARKANAYTEAISVLEQNGYSLKFKSDSGSEYWANENGEECRLSDHLVKDNGFRGSESKWQNENRNEILYTEKGLILDNFHENENE
jgi:hypothetical protein